MIVKRRPILTRKDIARGEPWFEFAVDAVNDRVEVVEANCFKADVVRRRDPNVVVDMGVDIAQARQDFAILGDKTQWILSAYLDGTIHFDKQGTTPPELMAHLGFYSPYTDELELLEFFDLGSGG